MIPADSHLRPPPRKLLPNSRWFGLMESLRRDALGCIRGNQGTFSLWVRPGFAPADGQHHTFLWSSPLDTNPGTGIILIKDALNQVGFYQVNNGGPSFAVVPATPANFAQNQWHHLGARYNDTELSLWLDGAEAAVGAAAPCTADPPAGAQMTIGYSGLFGPDSALSWIRNLYYWDFPLEDEFMVWLHQNRVGF